MPKLILPAKSRKVETRKGNDTVWAVVCLALSSKKRFGRLLLLIGVLAAAMVVIAIAVGVAVAQAPNLLHGLVDLNFSLFGEHPD